MTRVIDHEAIVLDSWFVVAIENRPRYNRGDSTYCVVGGLSLGNTRTICMGNESSTGTSVIVGDIDKKNAVIIQSEQPPNYDDLVRQGADPLQGDGEIFTTSLSHLRERLGTL